MILTILCLCLLTPVASGAESQPNLLANPGFECDDGGLDGTQRGTGASWENICGGAHPEIYSLDAVIRRSGKRSQRMSSEGYNCRFEPDGCRCFSLDGSRRFDHPMGLVLGAQAIAQTTAPGRISPGATYTCGVWVRIRGLTQKWEWFRLGLYWLDSNRRFISEVREDEAKGKSNYGDHDWKPVELRATAPVGAAFAKVYLHHHFERGTVWYDDAWLREVP